MPYEEQRQSIRNFIRDFKKNIITFWKQSDFSLREFFHFDDVVVSDLMIEYPNPALSDRDRARIWRTLTESRDNLTQISSKTRDVDVETDDIDDEYAMVTIRVTINITVNDETYFWFIKYKKRQEHAWLHWHGYTEDDLEHIQEKTFQVFKENLTKHLDLYSAHLERMRRSFDLYSAHGEGLKDLPRPLKARVKSYLAGGASAQQKSLLFKRVQPYLRA